MQEPKEMARIREKSQAVLTRIQLMALTLFWAYALTPTLTIATGASNSFAEKDHLFPDLIKWHVYVVNGLSNNQNMLARCKSKDDDLGIHNLSVGSNWTWSFKTDFFHSTLFWCYVSKDKASAAFEVFWYDARLFDKCHWKNCIWVAKDDGIYLTNLGQNRDEFRYSWDGEM